MTKVGNSHFYLGLFDTPEDAAKAYNSAAIRYHGRAARLNEIEGKA
ncbi:MAG TPA: hypothetical protein VJG32_17820 [Anaerolineae bacterium]|nr:hypothetical protein [Anaerolineae bacterium]